MPLTNHYYWLILVILWFPQNSYSEAHLEKFAYSSVWLKALHYEPASVGNKYESRIDDPRFFLHPNGKHDPLAEVQAMIEHINTGTKAHGKNIKCLMPYRYRIALENGLADDQEIECKELGFFKKEIGKDKLSIVFVAQYADNPSSIMGHLFLQVSNFNKKVEGKPVSYIYKTVNYAAGVAPDTNIFKYISYGIFGGFTGYYSLYEFADMIEKYNNMEGRDIFTYALNLSEEEVERVVEHLFELLEISSHDYFFFDENCAYQILAILEAVNPKTDLLRDLPFYTTPIDVLKIVAEHDLVEKIEYTPSLYQRLLDKLQAMTSEQRDTFDRVIKDEANIDKIKTPLVAEAIVDALNFRKHENQGRRSNQIEKQKKRVLIKRSMMTAGRQDPPQTTKISPHLSHGNSRFTLGAGISKDQAFFQSSFRPAIHSLLSRHEGFQRNTSMSLLEFEIRRYSKKEYITLDHIELVNIAKLNGTRVQHRPAWVIDFRLDSKHEDCSYCLTPNFNVLFGASRNLVMEKLDGFILGHAAYRPLVQDISWHGGLGATAGFSYTPIKEIRSVASISRLYNFHQTSLDEVKFGVNSDLSKNLDIQAEARYIHLNQSIERAQYWMHLGLSF